jgi:hypothetical protein
VYLSAVDRRRVPVVDGINVFQRPPETIEVHSDTGCLLDVLDFSEKLLDVLDALSDGLNSRFSDSFFCLLVLVEVNTTNNEFSLCHFQISPFQF